jgi:hypothetical protein
MLVEKRLSPRTNTRLFGLEWSIPSIEVVFPDGIQSIVGMVSAPLFNIKSPPSDQIGRAESG